MKSYIGGQTVRLFFSLFFISEVYISKKRRIAVAMTMITLQRDDDSHILDTVRINQPIDQSMNRPIQSINIPTKFDQKQERISHTVNLALVGFA